MNLKPVLAAGLAGLLLAACAPQSSVDGYARHVAAEINRIHFDPNTRPLTADNIRVAADFLRQFYEAGRKDRAAGLTVKQARLRVAGFSRNSVGGEKEVDDLLGEQVKGPFSPAAQWSTFNQQRYSAEQPVKRAGILLDAATSVYWDGYNGKP